MTGAVKCAIWARVSTKDQFTANQLAVLRAWAAARGLEVTAEFVTDDSASGAAGEGADFTARLPSERDLRQEFGVASMTARKAVRILVEEGLASSWPTAEPTSGKTRAGLCEA
jgi:DNA-binding transcriptional MocR family regulator